MWDSLTKRICIKKCCQCETIFDECMNCCAWSCPNPLLCHKSHITNNLEISASEQASIDFSLAEPIFIMYGEDTILRLGLDDLQRSFTKVRSDMTDSFTAEEFPKLAEFLNDGHRITIRQGNYEGSVLIEVFHTTKQLFK